MNGTGYPTWEEAQLRNLERFDKIIDTTLALNAVAEELRKGMAALAEVMATHADVDDLRAEVLGRIAEATATPFNPPEA